MNEEHGNATQFIESGEDTAKAFQATKQPFDLVVRGPCLPAVVEDANAFERQRPHSRLDQGLLLLDPHANRKGRLEEGLREYVAWETPLQHVVRQQTWYSVDPGPADPILASAQGG